MAGLFVKIARKREKVLLVTIRGRGGVTEKKIPLAVPRDHNLSAGIRAVVIPWVDNSRY